MQLCSLGFRKKNVFQNPNSSCDGRSWDKLSWARPIAGWNDWWRFLNLYFFWVRFNKSLGGGGGERESHKKILCLWCLLGRGEFLWQSWRKSRILRVYNMHQEYVTCTMWCCPATVEPPQQFLSYFFTCILTAFFFKKIQLEFMNEGRSIIRQFGKVIRKGIFSVCISGETSIFPTHSHLVPYLYRQKYQS